jgi:hypothetical protein
MHPGLDDVREAPGILQKKFSEKSRSHKRCWGTLDIVKPLGATDPPTPRAIAGQPDTIPLRPGADAVVEREWHIGHVQMLVSSKPILPMRPGLDDAVWAGAIHQILDDTDRHRHWPLRRRAEQPLHPTRRNDRSPMVDVAVEFHEQVARKHHVGNKKFPGLPLLSLGQWTVNCWRVRQWIATNSAL